MHIVTGTVCTFETIPVGFYLHDMIIFLYLHHVDCVYVLLSILFNA
jgi:hypothetical protein